MVGLARTPGEMVGFLTSDITESPELFVFDTCRLSLKTKRGDPTGDGPDT